VELKEKSASAVPEKFIDIEKILREKATRLYRILPGFVIGWLKRKLHEEDINQTIHVLKDKHGLEFNNGVLHQLGAKVESVHPERIPKTGGLLVASNHPLGGLDGMALIKAVGDLRPDVHFFVNDILKNLTNFGDIFVAVNKLGAVSAGSLRNIESVLETEAAVLIFPAGLVSRKQNGHIRDLHWKKTFVTQAIDHKRPVVPAFIEGENSKFFYRFANWRKRLRIKGNLEMLLLPDEMFSANKKTIRIHFGRPFSYEVFDKSRTHKKWAETVYRFIYSREFLEGMGFPEFIKRHPR
jgi:1-acyl-sn-glycerol-3-phosphate acyltransferase